MKVNKQPAPLYFATDEQLRQLLLEGINSGEGTVMTPAEWTRLRAELIPVQEPQRKVS